MIRFRPRVFRLRSDGTMLSDAGPGAWSLSAWSDRYWIAHFSKEWIEKYGSTWAVGIGSQRMWFYTP